MRLANAAESLGSISRGSGAADCDVSGPGPGGRVRWTGHRGPATTNQTIAMAAAARTPRPQYFFTRRPVFLFLLRCNFGCNPAPAMVCSPPGAILCPPRAACRVRINRFATILILSPSWGRRAFTALVAKEQDEKVCAGSARLRIG